MDVIVGLDPGNTGYVGVLTAAGEPLSLELIQSASWLYNHLAACQPSVIVVEVVSASPSQSPSGAFSFGKSAGVVEHTAEIYVDQMARLPILLRKRPQQWKPRLGLMRPDLVAGTYRENKAAARRAAEQLFPSLRGKLTNDNADGILIAEYGRRAQFGKCTA